MYLGVGTIILVLTSLSIYQYIEIKDLNQNIIDLKADIDYQKSLNTAKDKIISDQDSKMKNLVSLASSNAKNVKDTIEFQSKLCKASGKQLEAELNELQKAFEDSSLCVVYPSQCKK